MDIAEARAFLDSHIDVEARSPTRPPTRERIDALVELLGDPHLQYPVIHLTGTNGKTTTARMVAALLTANGLSVGTYTSPHLQRLNERIAWNGEPISDAALAVAIEAVAGLEPVLAERPNFFEILAAAAFAWFADVAVDAAVVETGIGATWDATSVVEPRVAVLTNVGLDHTELLGPTRADIAREKRAIAKAGSHYVLGETDPDLVDILRDTQAEWRWERGVDFACDSNELAHGGRLLDLRTPGASYEGVFLPLHGAHQGDNAACALAAVEAFFAAPLSPAVVEEGFASVRSPARIEIVDRRPLRVLDGAHNEAACVALAAAVDEAFDVDGRILVVGMMRERDPVAVLEALDATKAKLVVATAANWPRALPAHEVARAAEALGVPTVVEPHVADAVRLATETATVDDLVLVTGSLYVAGEARTALGLT